MSKNINTDQNGLGVVVIILLIVVLALVGGVGYMVLSKNKDKDNGSQQNSAEKEQAEAECKRTIDDKDLCKMASSTNYDSENFVMTITGTQDGQEYTWTVQNDAGNSHANMLGFESITYNNSYYLKDGSGAWVKYPQSTSEDQGSSDDLTSNLDFPDEEASWYTKVGKTACGNLTCFHYSYKDPADSSNNAEFYFDDKARES